MAIPLLWLLRTPLCIISGTAVAHPDGVACASEVTRTAQLSEGGVAALFVVGAGRGHGRVPRLARLGRAAIPAATAARACGWRRSWSWPWPRSARVVAALLLLDTSLHGRGDPELGRAGAAGPGRAGPPGVAVLRARDPRRFVLGVLAAAVLWLLLWYPNISGLPLPADFAHLYQGLLPTWNWDFQFSVNTDPASDGGIFDAGHARARSRHAGVRAGRGLRRPALGPLTRSRPPVRERLGLDPGRLRLDRGRLRPRQRRLQRRSAWLHRPGGRGCGASGTSASKPAGSASLAARRRMTKP